VLVGIQPLVLGKYAYLLLCQLCHSHTYSYIVIYINASISQSPGFFYDENRMLLLEDIATVFTDARPCTSTGMYVLS